LSNESKNSRNENLKLSSTSSSSTPNQLQTLSKNHKNTLDEAVNKLIEMEYEVSRRKDSSSFELVKNRTTYYLKNEDELIEYAMHKAKK
jgi:ppGpp synthetase/RelA/SpoT-type nucleotidyltranferase